MPVRVFPVHQIYGFEDFSFKNPQINGRQSGMLEKLQILKSIKPRLKNPTTFHLVNSGKLLNIMEPQFFSICTMGIR